MAEINMNDFDKHLENEFSKLGFNYQDIEANGIRNIDQYKSEMYLIDYLDSPLMLADGLAVIFTVINRVNEQCPVIEAMSATLFNDSCYGKFTALVEKKYSRNECSIPTKEQVLKEMTEMLRIKNVKEKFDMKANSPQLNLNHKRAANKKGL